MPYLPPEHKITPLAGAKQHEPPVPADNPKSWYKTPFWRKMRLRIFQRDHYTCQMEGCGAFYGHKIRMLVCDHKKPHRGIWSLFIDPKNLWTLCRSCHNSLKQKQEKAGLF